MFWLRGSGSWFLHMPFCNWLLNFSIFSEVSLTLQNTNQPTSVSSFFHQIYLHRLNCHQFPNYFIWKLFVYGLNQNRFDNQIYLAHSPANFLMIISRTVQMCIFANPAHCRGGKTVHSRQMLISLGSLSLVGEDHVSNPALSLVEPSLLGGSSSLLTVSHPTLVRMPYVLLTLCPSSSQASSTSSSSASSSASS